jgi:two-component system, cell cycle response regulator
VLGLLAAVLLLGDTTGLGWQTVHALLFLPPAVVAWRAGGPWRALGAGLMLYGAAWLAYAICAQADVELGTWQAYLLWLPFYPCAFAALIALARADPPVLRRTVVLDALAATCAAGALFAAFSVSPLLAGAGGDRALAVMSLAFPVLDLALVSIALAQLAGTGWRGVAPWPALTLAFGMLVIADSLWAYTATEGTFAPVSAIDVLFPAAALVVGSAAPGGLTMRRVRRPAEGRAFALPVAFGAIGLGLLIAGNVGEVAAPAVVLATATIAVTLARVHVTLRELQALRGSRREARTDSLTGLPNRRALTGALDALAGSRAPDPHALCLLDLDGFKAYNDAHGHQAGDALLTELARALQDELGDDGRAYRLGGDEFCVLAPTSGRQAAEALLDRARAALSGGAVTAAGGVVLLPEEASDAASALGIADRRMYREKRRQVRRGVTPAVLLDRIAARDPALAARAEQVARLAVELGAAAGLSADDLDDLRVAAQLTDLGVLALPPGAPAADRPAASAAMLALVPALAGLAPVVGAVGAPLSADPPLPARIITAARARVDERGRDGLRHAA